MFRYNLQEMVVNLHPSYLPYHFQACENLAYAFAHTVELSSDKSKFVVAATSQDDISRILQFTFDGEKKEHVRIPSFPPLSYRVKLNLL